MCHSLDSFSFLKIDPLNLISFKCQDPEDRIISVQQEWWKKNVRSEEEESAKSKCKKVKNKIFNYNETFYDIIYNIKIEEPTLRELLILQSFYVCPT